MNLLVLSNMAPSEASPTAGIFVQNQVDLLKQQPQTKDLLFLAIRSTKRGILALLLKYGMLMWAVLTQAVFNRNRFDVIHVHYFYPTIWFAIVYKLLRNRRAKIVVTFHGSDIYSFDPPSKLYRFAARFIDQCIFVSSGLKKRFFDQNIPAKVLSAGILDDYQPQSVEKRFDLIMVGAVNQNKGIDRLLAILDKLERGVNVGIVGEGPMVEVISAHTSTIHKLHYLGRCPVDKLIGHFNHSRFLLSLSRHESFGLVMAEAMACGTPVIATQTDGSLEQLKDNYNGLLINASQDSEKQLVDRACNVIMSALDNCSEAKYQQLSTHALSDAQRHTISHIVATLLGTYQDLCPDR